MNRKEKAQWLVDFYQQVADGSEMQVSIEEEWRYAEHGPCLFNMERFRIKPNIKKIDRSHLIKSGIGCKLRRSPYIYYWSGGECPLPNGLEVTVHFRSGATETENYNNFRWNHHSFSKHDIIGFEIVGLLEGWEW